MILEAYEGFFLQASISRGSKSYLQVKILTEFRGNNVYLSVERSYRTILAGEFDPSAPKNMEF